MNNPRERRSAAAVVAVLIAVMASAGFSRTMSFTRPSDEEFKLHRIINEYRTKKRLPAIRLSKSLTHVAQVHAIDAHNNPAAGRCNSHSWSDKGDWTPCCYTSDHRKAECMWNKPRELTNYTGHGYECGHWSTAGATAEQALRGWKGSAGHNAVIINKGNWASLAWKSIGVGIYGTMAYIWFGVEGDPDEYWE